MKRVAVERFLQRVKMTLGRDLDVLGILYLGPVLQLNTDRSHVRELDFLVVARDGPDSGYLQDLHWLPDGESILLSARFGTNRRDVLYSDGRVVRLMVYRPDAMPDAIGPHRVLLDRGGIVRSVRARATTRPPDRLPEAPSEPSPDHVVLLAWEAHLERQRGELATAERIARAAIELASTALASDPDAQDRVLLLRMEPLGAMIPRLALALAEAYPEAPGPRELQKWVGAPDLHWTPSEPSVLDPEPYVEPPEVDPETATRPEAEARRREPVLAQDACPFCGGALDPPGRLYVKGSLNDIRFLPGLSATLDLKWKVVARPCSVCGQISLRFQDGD